MFENFFYPQGIDEEGDFMPFLSMNDETDETTLKDDIPSTLPILALKNTVLFPGIVIPITVGRDKSIRAVHHAYESGRLIAVLSQRSAKTEDPSENDLYSVGTIARILKILKMPDGTTTAILQGRKRFALGQITQEEPYLEGTIQVISAIEADNELEFTATIASIKDLAQQIIQLAPNIPSEAMVMLKNIDNGAFLLNFITSNLGVAVKVKQQILEIDDLSQKAETVLVKMDSELQLLQLKDKIENKVRTDLEKQQRDYFLNQQLKTIQEELGNNPQDQEYAKLRERAQKMKWPEATKEVFDKDLKKLKRLNPQVAEYSVMLNYMELMLDLPWNIYTEDNFDLKKVKKILDKDHFGLEKVKDRILEHLAVLKLKGDMKAPILCLVGPPGVGKTSLGKSVANALDRKFVRMSLGGLHDESEIRGHRKTYIGAMPGRIIQSLKKVKSSNPVFILDEIDKVGSNFRGDPSSALLEVLDPEQNTTFHDNYLDVEYDLSKILFIATANSLNTIQPALRDRMEIIPISGYSLEEKLEIAKKHLIPNQRVEHGLKAKDVKLSPKVIKQIIQDYTRESGVRSLNRQIAGVMRSTAKKVAMEEEYAVTVSAETVKDILGPTKFSRDRYQQVKVPGVVVGLAWTSVGGDILFVEASLNSGKGKMQLTGNLGAVMKESAQTALSFIKAHSEELGIDANVFSENDVHIHVPEGAIPKDGPSAGITMLTALTSAFTGRKVQPNLAMTGEITLRGKVLPVGGIKEKILAAKRAGIKTIILCKENEKHVAEVNADYIKGVNFHYVERMDQVLELALK
ncbi:MAG: endopeptidase La [Bacteroidota bacterium]